MLLYTFRRKDLKLAVHRLRNQLQLRKTKKATTISVLKASEQEIKVPCLIYLLYILLLVLFTLSVKFPFTNICLSLVKVPQFLKVKYHFPSCLTNIAHSSGVAVSGIPTSTMFCVNSLFKKTGDGSHELGRPKQCIYTHRKCGES